MLKANIKLSLADVKGKMRGSIVSPTVLWAQGLWCKETFSIKVSRRWVNTDKARAYVQRATYLCDRANERLLLRRTQPISFSQLQFRVACPLMEHQCSYMRLDFAYVPLCDG